MVFKNRFLFLIFGSTKSYPTSDIKVNEPAYTSCAVAKMLWLRPRQVCIVMRKEYVTAFTLKAE